ncbi:PDR/VanB family oxidoreductase [Alloalcanivorax sp. C16-1]|uniref:PDR/VanB family oxidoreductase n=1 Tax=Alloalcanivorax sp. C16-1 TaxID=3390051 RepID=UPI00397048B9
MSVQDRPFHLTVSRFAAEAKDIALLELRDPEGHSLPVFSPGAHLELVLEDGLLRHYSLLNCSTERDRYVVAVHLAPRSRGGSSFIHSRVRQGDVITAHGPRNNFPLDEDAPGYLFVAGGIGVTPILSMVRWCERQGKRWRLLYACRNRQRAAFYETLAEMGGDRVQFHFQDEQEGRLPDVNAFIKQLPDGHHLYCCGPDPMMRAVRDHAEELDIDRVHFEWFEAPAAQAGRDEPQGDASGFDVRLMERDMTIHVPPDLSILEALEQQGIDMPYACRAGICRTCEVEVCGGEPDHRDFILDDQERGSGKTILVCVSRSNTDTLDLKI